MLLYTIRHILSILLLPGMVTGLVPDPWQG
jgi:hypothetical protein